MQTSLLAQSSYASRAARRFIFIYVVLYIVPYGFEYLHGLDTNALSVWTGITQWFGENVLGFTFNPENLNKGFDSKYDFSRFLLCILLSAIFTVIWLFIDFQRKKNYEEKLHVLLRTIIRYHVGLTLILYGMAKVFPLQFGDMGIDKLESQIGQHTPMSFLWVFMSYSKFWTVCTGLVETLAGILLLFRGTTFAGAFVGFIAMINVVLMDIGYDVSVKMFAIHLLLMIMVLLADDAKRLLDFFVFNKPTQPIRYAALFTSKPWRQAGVSVKVLLLVYFGVTCVNDIRNRLVTEHNHVNEPISMMHQVLKFEINGQTLPPLATDSVRWKNFSINGNAYLPYGVLVRYMTDERKAFTFKADTVKHILELRANEDSTDTYVLNYERLQDRNVFIFKGWHRMDSLTIETQPKSVRDYRLTKNSIRWIRDL